MAEHRAADGQEEKPSEGNTLEVAEHSLRKEAMWYGGQMSKDITIAPVWIARLLKLGHYRSSRGAASLAKSGCSSIYIRRWMRPVKSRSCLVVNRI